MKTYLAAIITLLITSLPSDAIVSTVTWDQDSSSSVKVLLEGVDPDPNHVFAFVSPSNLWRLSGNVFCFPSDPSIGGNMVTMGFLVRLVFDDTLLFLHNRFEDHFPIDSAQLISFENSWMGPRDDWSNGPNQFEIVSRPDLADISTWTWNAVFQTSGPALPVHNVPETGGVLNLLFGAIAVLGLRRLS